MGISFSASTHEIESGRFDTATRAIITPKPLIFAKNGNAGIVSNPGAA